MTAIPERYPLLSEHNTETTSQVKKSTEIRITKKYELHLDNNIHSHTRIFGRGVDYAAYYYQTYQLSCNKFKHTEMCQSAYQTMFMPQTMLSINEQTIYELMPQAIFKH